MKGDLAKAQREALRYIRTQKNPAVPLSFRGKQMLGLSTEKGMIPISKQVGSSGSWSTAYLSFADEKPTVFIETSDEKGEDLSKDVLVAINEQGHHPHIPIIEYFGTGQNGTKIYKMPLYDTQSELAMESRYGRVIDILREGVDYWYKSMTRQERIDYATNLAKGDWDKIVMVNIQRNAFIKYLEDIANYPTLMEPHFLSQKDKDTLSSIIKDLKVMNDYLTANDMFYLFEFPTRNLALDGNQQLILLDVIYPSSTG
jgi:hypothetical protein